MKTKLLSMMSAILICSAFPSQSLDLSFGNNGNLIHNNLGSFYDPELAVDGKVILPGNSYDMTDTKAVLVRLNADGTLDNSFNGNGRIEINQFTGDDYWEEFYNARILPDGKVLVLYMYEFDNGIDEEFISTKLIRYNADGSPDTTFSSPATSGLRAFEAFEVLPSGKILCVGNNALQRFLPNGALDTSYASNGIRTFSFEFWQMFVKPEGLFIVNYYDQQIIKMANEEASAFTYFITGSSPRVEMGSNFLYVHNWADNTVTKLDLNLQPVSSYGSAGVFTVPQDVLFNMSEIQPNGSIISLVPGGNTTTTTVQLRRINPNGTLDLTFGNQGLYTHTYSGDYSWNDIFYHPLQKKLYLWNEETNSMNVLLSRFNIPDERLAVTGAEVEGSKIKVLQNPVADVLRLSGILQKAQIYSASGNKTDIEFIGNEVSVDKLPVGLYYVSGTSADGKSVHLKFIKN